MEVFSINVLHSINMALDPVNGYLNIHFLNRLLTAIVLRLKLDQYDMDFTGSDAVRAQKVYSGSPDGVNVPLNSKFELRKRKSEEKALLENILENMSAISDYENVEESTKIKKEILTTTRTSITKDWTEGDRIEDDGALNLRALKRLEKLDFHSELKNDFISDRQGSGKKTSPKMSVSEVIKDVNMSENISTEDLDITQQLNVDGMGTQSDDNVLAQLKALATGHDHLVTKMKELETQLTSAMANNEGDVDPNKLASKIDLQNNSHHKRVRIRFSASEIFTNNDELISESKFNINDVSTEKYILKNHDPITLKTHIEKLLERLNKIEYRQQALEDNMSNKCESESDSSSSESSIDDDIIKPFTIKDQSFSSITQELKLKKLNKESATLFYKEFGIIRKKKELEGSLSIRHFRAFYEDYTENFQIIHDFLDLHDKKLRANRADIDDITENKLNTQDYLSNKNKVRATFVEIRKDIADYIKRDPEAAGMVQFVKGKTCISCEKPVVMKTIHVPRKHPTKGVFIPRTNIKTQLTHELDRIKKEHTAWPGIKNLLENKCKSLPSKRHCVSAKTKSLTPAQKVLLNDIVKETPLQRWISAKTDFKTSCGKK